jgi:hypothetical protein
LFLERKTNPLPEKKKKKKRTVEIHNPKLKIERQHTKLGKWKKKKMMMKT